MSSLVQAVKVPMYKKIAFGVGMLANQMFPAALGVFMVVLVDGFGFPVWMVGVLTFAPRLLDFIIDPIMGFITDNTRSKWGRRRHYVFIGALILGICFLCMWQIHKENGIAFNFFYFLGFKLCLYVGLTIFSIPFVAMGYEMSDDFHERTQIMAISQWIGQWAWVIVPWFWIIIYDKDWFVTPESGARTLSVWVAIICMFFAMVPALFIKGKSTLNDTSLKPVSIRNIKGIFSSLLHEFKEAFKIQDFRRLCYSTFFTFNAFNTVAQFTFFIIVYYLFNGDKGNGGIWAAIFGSGGALVTTFIVIPTVVQMSKKIGKKKAFLLSQGISIFGYIILFFLFVPGKPWLFLIALPFFSFGIGGLFTTMMSMTADVCDVDELNYGQRREGIFGAIYWWVVKLGFAFAGLLSYLILDAIGFDGNLPTQSADTIFWLRFYFSFIPILGTLVAIYFMWNYGITHERVTEIQLELAKRKAPKVSGYGAASVFAGVDLKGVTKAKLLQKYPSYYNTGIDIDAITNETIRQKFDEIFENKMHGICFSAYTQNQNPGDVITEEQIQKRLKVLVNHTSWVRVFSSTDGHEHIPKLAKQMGLKVMMGAWIGKDADKNNREIASLINLIKEGNVDIATVGNEVLFRGEQSEETVLNYIRQVKNQASGIPVCYVDTYNEYINHPKLVEASDKVLINCYPFWEGANIEHAGIYLQEMYNKTKAIAKGKDIMITETGWPGKGDANGEAVPSNENQMLYFIEANTWAKQANINLFYFSSFDESWKVHSEGWAGTSWGLWDENEKLKFEN
jgi:glycoside/pentoside/hexuronide:cation symporter, GPH family